MKIQLQKNADANAVYDITDCCSELVWSGDYQQAARKFEFKALNPTTDTWVMPDFPVHVEIGDTIYLYMYGEEIFRGRVWDKTEDSSEQYSSITCYDELFRLTKTQISKYFVDVTPEDITAQMASEYNIYAGDIATTGLSGNYVSMGKTPYEVIMAGYTRASKQNDKKYLPRMNMGYLDIIEKGTYTDLYILDPSSTLISSKYDQSLEDMVNSVIVYDSDDGSIVLTKTNDSDIALYGIIQSAISYEKDKDNDTLASNQLKEMSRKAEVKALGNDNYCITGNCVFVKDIVTGLYGKFFIDGDSHEITQESDIMTLTLSFENLMDEQEMDSELQKSSDSSSGSDDSSSGGDDVDTSNAEEMTVYLSFYTGEASEGGNEGASGKTLEYGMCASNVYPFGTQFKITGINGLDDGVFTVEDRGGSDFDSPDRLDIYVGVGGDSVSRANNLGRQTCTAYRLN